MLQGLWRPALMAWVVLACAPGFADDCQIGMAHTANTYYTDEPVRMSVLLPSPARPVHYVITDDDNLPLTDGTVSIGGEQPVTVSMPRKPGPGYYRLSLTWEGGSHEESFCVLPRPYEDPGDYSIFALCPDGGATDENLAPAAQMGVRLIRQTVPWPPFEPQRGQWRMDLLQTWYDVAARHGMQMMLILGYTPPFIAQKPINYLDDWVNACTFTWHPTDTGEYARYLDKVTGFAQGKSIRWPPASVMPPQNGPMQQSLAWTHSWEMWNEADIMFYVGDWNRYMDLLRMSWSAGRQRLPRARMVYGGSTGNFGAMGMVASGSSRYALDYVGLHTGGPLETQLRVWYSGAQQIPWCVGAPRETAHTECYAQGRGDSVDYSLYQETPGQLQRCYLTLKAWREAAFYRSGILGGYIRYPGVMAPGTSLLVPQDGKLQPTPLYPAFAATRKLLSDAVEVGPVNLGRNITAHVFLKHGQVMLAAWSDAQATATIQVSPSARQIDPFGRGTLLGVRTAYTQRLGVEPLVIIGARANKYLPEALRRRYDLLSRSAYGTTQTNPDCWVWYVNPMSQDLRDLLGTTPGEQLGTAVEQAARDMTSAPDRAPASLVTAQCACMQVARQLLATCPVAEDVPVKVANNLWRLARMEEWLGEIADDRSNLWHNLQVDPAEAARMAQRIPHARQAIGLRHGEGQLPVAEHLLDRAEWQVWRLNQYQRKGTLMAILHKVQVAEELNRIEKGFVLRVVPVVDFGTGRPFRKARVLEPGQAHTLSVSAYNYLDHAVSGTLRLKLPAGWTPGEAEVPFSASGGQASATASVPVTLPQEPTPWVQASSFTLDGFINVSLPSILADRPTLEIGGELSTGEPLSPMTYFLNVGHWLDDPSAQGESVARAQQAGANEVLRLPPAIKQAQARSVIREMERLREQPAGDVAAR